MEQWSCKNEALRELKLYGAVALKIATTYSIIWVMVGWNCHDAQEVRRSGGHTATGQRPRNEVTVCQCYSRSTRADYGYFTNTKQLRGYAYRLGNLSKWGELEDFGEPFQDMFGAWSFVGTRVSELYMNDRAIALSFLCDLAKRKQAPWGIAVWC